MLAQDFSFNILQESCINFHEILDYFYEKLTLCNVKYLAKCTLTDTNFFECYILSWHRITTFIPVTEFL